MITTPRVSLPQHKLTSSGSAAEIVDIGGGRYLAAWVEGDGGPTGTSLGTDIIGQIFDADGNRIGNPFELNAKSHNENELAPALASRPGGGFVTAYEVSANPLNPDPGWPRLAIDADVRDANGAFVSGMVESNFLVIDASLDNLRNGFVNSPSIAVRPNGSYLVAYMDGSVLVGRSGIPSELYPPPPIDYSLLPGTILVVAGLPPPAVTLAGLPGLGGPKVDALSNGNYVIGFVAADDSTLSDYDPHFMIVPPALVWSPSPTVMDIDSGANNQTDLDLAALAGGGFVAVWTEQTIDGDAGGIRARIYDNDGTALGAAFTVNDVTAGNQDLPAIVALHDGGFVVAWRNDLSEVVAQRFDAAGTPIGAEFTAGSADQVGDISITTLSDGRFIVSFGGSTGGNSGAWSTTFATETAANDFNFDLRSDILWRHDNGTVATSDMNGPQVMASHTFAASADWHIQGTADFNADGYTDILWRHDSGLVGTWHMQGATGFTTQSIANAPTDWHIQGTGDFNGDDRGDILWRHDSGLVGIWQMDGATVLSNRSIGVAAPLDWHIAGTGDFNGDGKTDILWRNDNGAVGTWHMNGSNVLSTQVFGNAPNTWHIEGVGDFDGDGKDDILWRSDDGTVGTWHMNGAAVPSTQIFANAPLDWHIEGVGDYNADGKDDILWRNDDGTVGTWHMNGATVLSTQTFGITSNEWHVIGNQFEFI